MKKYFNCVPVNREVSVTAMYFENNNGLHCYPRRIEYNGHEYTFMRGLRYLIQKGQRMVQVFDMTDGQAQYRLNFDQDQKLWTLVDIAEPPRVMV